MLKNNDKPYQSKIISENELVTYVHLGGVRTASRDVPVPPLDVGIT